MTSYFFDVVRIVDLVMSLKLLYRIGFFSHSYSFFFGSWRADDVMEHPETPLKPLEATETP